MPLVLSDVRLVTLKAMGQHRDHVNTRAKVGFYPRDVRIHRMHIGDLTSDCDLDLVTDPDHDLEKPLSLVTELDRGL